MKTAWIVQEKKRNLLVFFNGWGMDEEPFKHFVSEDYDMVILYDYRNFEGNFPLSHDVFSTYDKVYVIGWSYGVWISSFFTGSFPAEKTRFGAINGTGCPIDENFGILPRIFQTTLDNFSPAMAQRFYLNMFNDPEEYKRFCTVSPRRSADEQKEELEYIRKKLVDYTPGDYAYIEKVIISRNDKVIFQANQTRFWKTRKAVCKTIDQGHFPFFSWDSIDSMVLDLFS